MTNLEFLLKEEDRALYLIKNEETNDSFLLGLTPAQVRFYEWMEDNVIDGDWNITLVRLDEIETI